MTSTPTVSPERAMRVILTQKLGGRLISAVPVGGGFSNAGLYRVRAHIGGERGEERDLVIKLSKARGSLVTDDLD